MRIDSEFTFRLGRLCDLYHSLREMGVQKQQALKSVREQARGVHKKDLIRELYNKVGAPVPRRYL